LCFGIPLPRECRDPISGFYDLLHQPFDRNGSDDPALEGFFDLSGLEVPSGDANATYELSAEAVNPLYSLSTSVGPYKAGAVAPSGTFVPLRVTIARGEEAAQDIAMQGSAAVERDSYEPNSFAAPATIPTSGDWSATLSGYGDRDYVIFHGSANRSFTFDVTALNETGFSTTSKSQPVIGIWGTSDAEDVSQVWENSFNSTQMGMTRMQGAFVGDGDYKLGVVDSRGDGRPDFAYRARLFYADDLSSPRASVRGGTTLQVNGLGFTQNTQVIVGSAVVTHTLATSNQITFQSPALADGIYNLLVQDASSGATSQMDYALLIGSAEAKLVLVDGSNPQVPIGTIAPNPIRVRVVDINTGVTVGGGDRTGDVTSFGNDHWVQ
jgi:IPT/TIG domain